MGDDAPYWKYLVPWNGEVVANNDPLRLGRVQVNVPGLLEPSGWVLPRGFGGVHYDVPRTRENYKAEGVNRPGDEVEIVFIGGDCDQPRYSRAHGGIPDDAIPEVPDPVKTMNIEDAPLIKAEQFGNWLLVCDDRPATKGMTIKDIHTGEEFFIYDAVKMGLQIRSPGGLQLGSDGELKLFGLLVEIMGRRVSVSRDWI
jgi:hypothetical protein